MVEPGPDLYQVLGVAREATGAEITRAYRRRARAVHPDTAPPGAGAAARFRAVSDAYQVLSNPARRAAYDHASYRETAPGHSPAAPGRARPRPAAAGMPPAWPRVSAGPGPLRMPALWAGPVRVEPIRATAAGPGPGAGRQAGAAGQAGLASRYAGARRNGLR